MTYRVTASTMGSVTPGPAVLSGGYRYQGDPGWYPNHPSYQEDDQPPASGGDPRENVARHAERMARFAAARDKKLSIAVAARQAGVTYKTGLSYERRRAGSQEPAS